MLLRHQTILADTRSLSTFGGAGLESASLARRIAAYFRKRGEPATFGEALRRPVTEFILRVLAAGAFVAALYAVINGSVGLAVVL